MGKIIKLKQSQFQSIQAKTHTPPYKIHRYFARRPWNVFESLIQHYSSVGDTVLDPFCGGGVTVYEGVKTGRKVLACDINPLSTYIVKNMFYINLPSRLQKVFEEISEYLSSITAPSFGLQCPACDSRIQAGWYELAHVVDCHVCGSNIILTEANKVRNGIYKCSNPKCWGHRTGVSVARSARKIPSYLSVNGRCPECSHRFSIQVDNAMLDANMAHVASLRREVAAMSAELPDEIIPLEWDRQKEDLLKDKGIVRFQDMFTKKNLYINYLLLAKIKQYRQDKESYSILRFAFSDSLRDSNIMTFTNGTWQNGTPNSWAKHAYWLPSQFCEVNILHSFARSFSSIRKSIEFNKLQRIEVRGAKRIQDLARSSNLYIKTGTLADLAIPPESVDVVITDPPYGSNVQYLELSHFWHMWNKDMYAVSGVDFRHEAVVNRKSTLKDAKGYKEYEDNLYAVFEQCHKALKPHGHIVMTFNNKDLKAWLALLISMFRSDFHFELDGITFQDGVTNYRHTAHTKAHGSPYGDFIYKFVKDAPANKATITQMDRDKLIESIKAQIDLAVTDYRNGGKDKNQILVELFNRIVPEIEAYVRISKKKGIIEDLYDVFSKSHLEPLYAA